jgi:hypothetical protein
VSSEKDETAAEAGVEEDKGDVGSILPATVVMGGYCRLPKPPEVGSRAAKVAKTLKSSTPARLNVYETLLERLAQDLEDMAAELGPCIQEEHAIVGQRHVTWHRHVAPADQLFIRDGVVRRVTRAGRDPRRARAGAAGVAVNTRGLNGLGEGHPRQDGGEPPCQHRRARPRGAEQKGNYGQNACITFIITWPSRHDEGEPTGSTIWVT